MSLDELRAVLRIRPFVPFRLHLTDGRAFDVFHPDCILLSPRVVHVGVYPVGPHNGEPVFDRIELISVIHIVSLESLAQNA